MNTLDRARAVQSAQQARAFFDDMNDLKATRSNSPLIMCFLTLGEIYTPYSSIESARIAQRGTPALLSFTSAGIALRSEGRPAARTARVRASARLYAPSLVPQPRVFAAASQIATAQECAA